MATPSLDDIALFSAIADAGGFRVAAQKRGLSASSLSDAMRRLEADLGVRLLNRTTRSVTPTEAGKRLLERLRPALSEIGDAIDGAGADADRPTGTLRLNVPTIVARHILPPIAARFLLAHPGVRLEVSAQDMFVDILAAGFDAGIRYEESIARDMIAVPIGPARQRFAVGGAPAYLARHGTPRHPRDLADHARIGHRFASGSLAIWDLERSGRRFRIAPDGPLIASSIEMALAAAEAGLGLIATFEDTLADSFARGTLIRVLEDWTEDFPGPSLYYPSRRLMPAPLRAFVDFVKADRPDPPSRVAKSSASA
ncbi:LysR family transcriptional regulator [Flavisphingomonas formosensis]|uniref:LysR family transcriptional regulator n=1 Tax=Flavisphingomonas formosensis TaxID=861534 RepID=UPI0012F9777B|nr:LysR family transcriptional regulator [Sphingomonas formosensis]